MLTDGFEGYELSQLSAFADAGVALPCRFLYSDEVHIGPETVMTTLYTAKKYAVPALEGYCVEFLTKHLRADNAFMLLTQVSLQQAAFQIPLPQFADDLLITPGCVSSISGKVIR